MNASPTKNPASRPAILLCGAAILLIALGTRQSFGLFLRPMSIDMGWGRETFAFALALQNLVWGVAQPFAGAVADRHGAVRVFVAAGLLYALGLVAMAEAASGATLGWSAGVLIGLGLSGTGFGVVMGVVGRSVSPERRSLALGIVGAGGSFGQFAMLPWAQTLISGLGWQQALVALAAGATLILPLALAFRSVDEDTRSQVATQSIGAALGQAASHRGFWYLGASFLVCGFQTAFIMIHLPAYLYDAGMSSITGTTALALVGLFNVAGSYVCGLLGGIYSKKVLLGWIYLSRAVMIAGFIALPVSPVTTYVFSALIGLTWLGTVPLTNGLVAQIFGVRYLATLFSIAFLGHQIGSFLGAWYGGYVFDLTGSYLDVWLIAIGASLLASALCWPIDERSVGGPEAGAQRA